MICIQEKRELEQAVRSNNIRQAWASVQLEAYQPSDYARELGEQYIKGKITAGEQVTMIRKHYGLEQDKGTIR